MLRSLVTLCGIVTLIASSALPAQANGILLGSAGSDRPAGERHPVRLAQHRVQVKISDQVAQVTVEQVFRSHARRQLEGTYLFPLPEGAVVSDFAMTMAGKMVKGEVVEAKRARRIYEGIVARRKDPGLLEYVGRGMFRARVFPIEPGKDLTIRLSFQQVLPDDGGTLEFRYPLATDRMSGRPVSSATVSVDIDSQVDLKAIYSTSHKVEIKRDGETKAHASFESHATRQKEDFVLYIGRSPRAVGFSMLSHKEAAKDGTFMTVIAPQNTVEADAQAARDVIFVLDTSGSMQGNKIKQARKALAYGVETLGPKDRFNIIAFSTSTRPFRDALVPANDGVRAAAQTWIAGLQAAGGTDIHSALSEALAITRDDRNSMIVFLTDGLPSVGTKSTSEIRKHVVAANKHGARLFTFGVGHDLDVRFLDRLAEESHGARDYVAPTENIEIVTSRFFRKVSRPVLTNVKLDLGEGVYDVYPRVIGDLFAGSQVVLFGRYRKAGARTITLTGTLAGKDVRHEHKALLRANAGPDYLERLWANRKVAFLLDNIRLHGESKELVDEVIALATKHSFVTRYTSGLVVEDHVETDNDLPFAESFGGNRGLSDAPFEGPSSNGTIGIGGGAGGAFRGRGGGRDLGTGGGGRKKFEDAMDDALRWLAAHQLPNGGWSARDYDRFCDGKAVTPWEEDGLRGRTERDVHVTAQAVMAFLGAGYTNRGKHPFAKVVSKAMRHLKNIQDPEGCFGSRSSPDFMSGSAQAALAMIEAYGMTGSPIFKGSAQRGLDFLALARTPYGVWSRAVKGGEGDLRVTTWAVNAYFAASLINQDAIKRGKRAQLHIDMAFEDSLRTWMDSVADKDYGGVKESALPFSGAVADEATRLHRARTGAAMIGWIRLMLGADPRKDKDVKLCVQRLMVPKASTARWNEEGYFGTYLLHETGGKQWSDWKKALDGSTGPLETQEKVGDYCGRKGSWLPEGPRAKASGRVSATALRGMELMVFHRYWVSGRSIRAVPQGSAPRRRPASQPQTPAAPMDVSKDLKRRKDAASAAEVKTTGRTRTIAGKTFVQETSGRWVDTAWDRKATPKPIEVMSEAYFALSRGHADTPKQLAVGDRLVIVIDGTPYEIVAPK